MDRFLGAVGLHIGNPRPQIFIAVQNILRIQQLLDRCPANLGNLVGRTYRNIGLVFFTLQNGVPEKIGLGTLRHFKHLVVYGVVVRGKSRLLSAFTDGGFEVRFIVLFTMSLWESPLGGTGVVDQ
jgi:hypothetical protein